MRKLLVMMLSLALCISMSVTAFAADTSTDSEASETDYDVLLFVDDTGESLVVELQALNAVTDGVVTITYDTSVVSVEESDVVANLEAVDKYSINAEEAGTLKISWISEE
ncbi:MAG: hypothetical protein LUC90_05980 [Lachnospiraceae bacterium]|nr:hypothetical protein [Lachnospiraceae bacterium]